MKEQNISRITTAVAGAGLMLSGVHTVKESIDFFDLAEQRRNTEYGSMQEGSRLIGQASYGLIFAPAGLLATAPREKVCIDTSTNVVYYTAPDYTQKTLSEALGYLGNTSLKNTAIVFEIKDIKYRVKDDIGNDPVGFLQNEPLSKKVNPDCRIDEQKRLNEITEQIMKKAENVKSDEDESLQMELRNKLLSVWKSQTWVVLFGMLFWKSRKGKVAK